MHFSFFFLLRIDSCPLQTKWPQFLPPPLVSAPHHYLFSIPDPFPLLCFDLSVKIRLPRENKQNKTRYNKKRQKPSYLGWTRQLKKKKTVPRSGKKVRNKHTPAPTPQSSAYILWLLAWCFCKINTSFKYEVTVTFPEEPCYDIWRNEEAC